MARLRDSWPLTLIASTQKWNPSCPSHLLGNRITAFGRGDYASAEPAKFSEGLNPPPNLKKVVNDLQPEELFWIIKNGIKMTGMPSFGAEKPPLTNLAIWSIVAFLKKLPNVSDEDFKAWSAP